MVALLGTADVAATLAMLSATAAATLTLLPLLVDALGAAGAVVLPPPLADWVVVAKLRSPPTWLSTSPAAESGAPDAPAVESERVVEVVLALKLAAPALVSMRAAYEMAW